MKQIIEFDENDIREAVAKYCGAPTENVEIDIRQEIHGYGPTEHEEAHVHARIEKTNTMVDQSDLIGKEDALKVLDMFLCKQCDLERTSFAYDQNTVWDAVKMATDALAGIGKQAAEPNAQKRRRNADAV